MNKQFINSYLNNLTKINQITTTQLQFNNNNSNIRDNYEVQDMDIEGITSSNLDTNNQITQFGLHDVDMRQQIPQPLMSPNMLIQPLMGHLQQSQPLASIFDLMQFQNQPYPQPTIAQPVQTTPPHSIYQLMTSQIPNTSVLSQQHHHHQSYNKMYNNENNKKRKPLNKRQKKNMNVFKRYKNDAKANNNKSNEIKEEHKANNEDNDDVYDDMHIQELYNNLVNDLNSKKRIDSNATLAVDVVNEETKQLSPPTSTVERISPKQKQISPISHPTPTQSHIVRNETATSINHKSIQINNSNSFMLNNQSKRITPVIIRLGNNDSSTDDDDDDYCEGNVDNHQGSIKNENEQTTTANNPTSSVFQQNINLFLNLIKEETKQDNNSSSEPNIPTVIVTSEETATKSSNNNNTESDNNSVTQSARIEMIKSTRDNINAKTYVHFKFILFF